MQNPIKIYWVASVWAKWQIILPAESRKDFQIEIWKIYNIHSISVKQGKKENEFIAFSIFDSEKLKNTYSRNKNRDKIPICNSSWNKKSSWYRTLK